MSLTIPVYGEADLPWSYFLLQAARGSVRVPDWVHRALPAVVAAKRGKQPEEVDDDDLTAVLEFLPPDPAAVLWRLLLAMDTALPDPAQAGMRLEEAAVRGAHRDPVSQLDLLHDVAVMMQVDYGAEAFHTCLANLDDDAWDARAAVAAMIYLLLVHYQ